MSDALRICYCFVTRFQPTLRFFDQVDHTDVSHPYEDGDALLDGAQRLVTEGRLNKAQVMKLGRELSDALRTDVNIEITMPDGEVVKYEALASPEDGPTDDEPDREMGVFVMDIVFVGSDDAAHDNDGQFDPDEKIAAQHPLASLFGALGAAVRGRASA